ncbi:MAG: winged helix-turn-helix transcriptional regulator [Thaumarchaeota archaeon]|nr:winged helix-turn-helix transcriptional regulator [Nitrososphaerota archaeon]
MVLQLLTDRELQILSFLAKHPRKSAFQISVDLKVTQSTVYKALNRLAREGVVKTDRAEGSDVWSVVSHEEFREIFVRAVDELSGRVYS